MFPARTPTRNRTLELLGLSQADAAVAPQSSAVAAAAALNTTRRLSLLGSTAPMSQLQSLRGATGNPLLDQPPMNSDAILAALINREKLRQEAALLAVGNRAQYASQLDAAALIQARAQNALSLDSLAANQAGLPPLASSVQQETAVVNEAFQRGKEEAILSLLRSGAVDPSFLKANQAAQRQPAAPAPPAPKRPSASRAVNAPPDFHKMPPVSGSVAGKQGENTSALEAIGVSSLERRKKNAPYFDASSLADPDAATLANRRTRGGVTEPFPEKLHRLIRDAEANGESDVISFFSHGRAFAIHHEERFCREIMPRYFKQSRFSSFQRQLNLYGFTRITNGPDARGYYHELFLKGRPALVIHMRRVGFPKPQSSQAAQSKPSNPAISPDFYSMPAIKGADESIGDEQKQSAR